MVWAPVFKSGYWTDQKIEEMYCEKKGNIWEIEMLLQKRIHPIVAAADSNKSRVALRSFFVNIKAVIRFVDFETCAFTLI